METTLIDWLHQLGTLEFWEALLEGFEGLGPLVPILLAMLESIFPPLPLIAIVALNIAAHGGFLGFVYSWLGVAAGGTVGFTTGAGAGDPAGAKKSSAAVSTASGTTGLTMARGGAFWSGSCPKVPPGPMMMGSMGSLPPSETEVSGPRSISNAARGWLEVTLTGSKAGAGRAGAGSGSTGAGGS